MRVIFAGTPDFAVPVLQRLTQSGIQILAVLTQPDRAAGRGRGLKPGPVKLAAERLSLPVLQPTTLRDDVTVAQLKALEPEVIVVVAYGLILSSRILEIPRFGCVNVHASLLPRWRGAAPIARAIEAGDEITGVSIMKMDEGLDTGPVIATRELHIEAEDNAATLHDKLASLGADLLLEVLPRYVSGETVPHEQSHHGVTYAKKLTKSEGHIDWTRPASEILNRIRAFYPWPVAYTSCGGKKIRILEAVCLRQHPPDTRVGVVVGADKKGIQVVCGDGCLSLLRLQREGGKPLPAGDFLNGFKLVPGDRLQ